MRTPEEMLNLVEEYQKSGKSRKEFSLAMGLKPTTFSYWIKKKRLMDNPEGSFIKLNATIPSLESQIEIIFPNGVRVKSEKADLPFLSQLIRSY